MTDKKSIGVEKNLQKVKNFKSKNKYHTLHVIEKTLKDHIVEWVAAILSIIGIILNANLFNITSFDAYIYSFYFWVFGNLCWIYFSYKHKHLGVLVTFSVYCVINTLAILKHAGIIRL